MIRRSPPVVAQSETPWLKGRGVKANRMIVPAVVFLAGGVCALVFVKGPSAVPDDYSLVAQSNNQFAVDLYQKLRDNQGNLFFSPYSLFTALGMTYAGARGTTQEQMAQVMSLPTSAEVLRKMGLSREPIPPAAFAHMCGSLTAELNANDEAGRHELSIVNAMWGRKDMGFLRDYLRLVEGQYNGRFQNLDFARAEQSARTINAWVQEQTKGKITDLVSPAALSDLTSLVLTNAVYFKGRWMEPFQKNGTTLQPFRQPGGLSRQVSLMHLHKALGYAETDDLQILELQYVGERLSMVILLPRQVEGITKLDEQLTGTSLSKWLSLIAKTEVSASIPRFQADSTFNLNSALIALGMTEAFSESADFSGMVGRLTTPDFLSDVVHKACVDVDEEGTEAAAATGVRMAASAPDPSEYKTFTADHPFIYLIRDRVSGSVLFLGRLVDPASAS
jgi:serpin B